MNRRVVVTGIGLITPLGLDVKDTWNNLIAGKSGIVKNNRCDVSNLPCQIAGLVGNDLEKPFNAANYINAKEVRKMDIFMQYGIIAAQEAIRDSNINTTSEDIKENTGTLIGSGIGGLKAIDENAVKFHANPSSKTISPFFIPSCLSNLISGHISIMYGFRGPNHSVVTACATGAHAIGDAARIIKCNDANIMIAGGSEAAITPLGIAGFAAVRALSTKYNDNPQAACRPWDKDRDGFVMSEGAGIVVLEELEHAKKRNAKIYAEIVGYSLTSDAHHITSPHPEGKGGYFAMLKSLRNANINIEDIDYINAHATSTIAGDLSELKAIQNLFLAKNPKIAVSSTKSSTGHLLGATGSVEIIFSILAMRDQVAPPTLNLDNPIDEVKLNLVPNTTQSRKINYVLSNSFGFGGTNTSIVLKRFDK